MPDEPNGQYLCELDDAVAQEVMRWRRVPKMVHPVEGEPYQAPYDPRRPSPPVRSPDDEWEGSERGANHLRFTTSRPYRCFGFWQPSRDIAQAWIVIAELLNRNIAFQLHAPCADRPSDPTRIDGWIANFSDWGMPFHYSAWGTTATVAICEAALKYARKEQV